MLYLIRGLPGSGKSTWAQKAVAYDFEEGMSSLHLEADMYFLDKNGKYVFDGTKLKEAHKWCLDTTRIMLISGWDVYVSNTFTQLWEMQPYLDLGKDLGIEVDVLRCSGDFGSIHNVPQVAIDRMKTRFQNYEGEIFVQPYSVVESTCEEMYV